MLNLQDALAVIHGYKREAEKALSEASTMEEVLEVNRAYLGKNGKLTLAVETLKDLAPQDRPPYGSTLYELRAIVSKAVKVALAKNK